MSINFTALEVGAISFTLALAWNRAVSKTVEGYYPAADKKATARAALVAAIVLTLLVIALVEVLNRAHRAAAPPHQRPPAEGAGHKTCADCGDCEHCYQPRIVRLEREGWR